jgi:hypothetical protein
MKVDPTVIVHRPQAECAAEIQAMLLESAKDCSALTSEKRGAGPRIAAIVPRSDNPEDDLVIYEEKADRATINWILSLTKKGQR